MSQYIQLPLPLPDATIEIPLSNGGVSCVNAVDADLCVLKWYSIQAGNAVYACSSLVVDSKRKLTYMHRIILERKIGRPLASKELCDHIDRDGLNNCRNNLRISTRSQNRQNGKQRSDSVNPYKGITFDKVWKKWQAQITVVESGVKRNLRFGPFDTPEAAHEAYCAAARKYFGEFARLE